MMCVTDLRVQGANVVDIEVRREMIPEMFGNYGFDSIDTHCQVNTGQ